MSWRKHALGKEGVSGAGFWIVESLGNVGMGKSRALPGCIIVTGKGKIQRKDNVRKSMTAR